ncbi:MAG: type II CAAX endopeptidase family protein [Thermoplasmatales archaeon]|nr:type II CAAX endopeptidase family protein [Thermoplasmatales archaeon]
MKIRTIIFMLLPPVIALLSNIFVSMFIPIFTLAYFIIPSAVLYIVFVFMIYFVCRKWKMGFKELLFKKPCLKDVGVGFLGALATIPIGFFIWGLAFWCVDSFKIQGFTKYLMIGLDSSTQSYSLPIMILVMILLFSLAPAFVEETYFRGLVIRKMQKLKFSPMKILLIQAFIFGLWHWHWGLIRGFLLTFIMALILAKLYLRQKNIFTPITAHFVNNTVLYSLGMVLTFS